MEKYEGIAEKYGIKKLKKTVIGKETRQLSALEGFKAISDRSTFVAVHDAARCLVTPEMIEKTVRTAVKYGAAVAASKATDTVKVTDNRLVVKSTPERDSLWLAATPQIFETEIYRASAYLALDKGLTVTDDCSMVESAGFKIKLIDCGKENLKITEQVDLYFAEAVLKMRRESTNES